MAFKKGVQKDGSWYVYAGDRNRAVLQFKADDLPWDLTGSDIQAHARKKDTDLVPALVAYVEVVDAHQGMAAVSWDGDQVRLMLDGRSTWQGFYDIQLLQPGQALPDTLHRAKFVAQMDITRG